jgi:hypothetical protein
MSGSQSTAALTAATKNTLACTGAGGSASQSTTVSVTPATTGTATLAWVAPTSNTDGTALTLTPLTGYTIYYGTSQGSLTQFVVVRAAHRPSRTKSPVSPQAPGTSPSPPMPRMVPRVHEVALVDDQLSIDVAPLVTVLGVAVRVTDGAGVVTEMVADCAALPPAPLQVSV